MFDRIWKKFTLALLVVAYAPIAYFGYYDLIAKEMSVTDATLKEVFINTITRGKEIERTFINARVDINDVRSSLALKVLVDSVRDESPPSAVRKSMVEQDFIRFLSLRPGYSRIGFLDDYGDEIVIVYRSGSRIVATPSSGRKNRLTSAFYIGAARLADDGVAVMPMRSSVHPSLDLPTVTLVRHATKVFDSSGVARGVVYIDLNGSELFDRLTRMTLESRRVAALVTNEGDYIYNPFVKPGVATIPPTEVAVNVRKELGRELADQLLSGGRGVISDHPDYLWAYNAVHLQEGDSKRYLVVFDRYARSLFAEKLYEIKRVYAIGAIFTVILVVLVAVLVSRALTVPINTLRRGVEKFKNHDFDHRIRIDSRDEIKSLSLAYNEMADDLQEYSRSLELKVSERTDRIKEVERQLMRSEKLAALGFLSAGVAHEINNPISVIVMRLDLVKKALQQGDMEIVEKDIEVVKNHAIRISTIARSLLTFAREGDNKLMAVDLNEVIGSVLSLIGHPLKSKGISVKSVLQTDLPQVWANLSGMERVIYNLVQNSYQACASGDILEISTRKCDGGGVELTVRDTGPGIGKESLERIFEPFYTTKEVGEGTGLGLSISYGLIRDFGGEIDVKSVPGEGALFTITLENASDHLIGGGEKKI